MKRRLTLAFVLASVATAIELGTSQPVSAECRTDPISLITTCWLQTPPRAARRTPIGDGATSAFVWVQVPTYRPADLLDPQCQRREQVDPATGAVNFFDPAISVVWLENALTGEQVTDLRVVCLFPGDPGPAPPPPPPSPAEFVEASRAALTVQTSLNPRVEIGGLTGLDTWLWCDNPGEVNVAVTLRGWTAEATVEPAQFAWAISGTASAGFHADGCGSEADPAASWMPETMGPYTVALTSTWAGTWTLSYNGFLGGVFPLGPYDFAAPAIAYPVDEYRGVLTPPNTDGR